MNDTRKRRPTLQDIADLTGVTKMTVSRYLRDPSAVAEGTRERIAAAVEELGYIPNRAPDMLSNATSKAIGILIPSLSNQVFSAVIHGIEAVTRPAGYQTLLAHYGYSPEREEEQVASLLSYNVDGLILSDTQHTERTRKMIATAGIPVVETMDLPLSPIDMVVGMDHRAAARAMVTEMLRRGRRKVIYLGARLDVRTQLRMEGYYQAMADFGLTGQHLLTEQSSSFTLGGELLAQAMARFPDLDGLFCTNDDLAAAMPGQVDPGAPAGGHRRQQRPRHRPRHDPQARQYRHPPRDHRSRSRHHAAGPPRRPAAGDQVQGHRLLPL